jgi:hypothetical protein
MDGTVRLDSLGLEEEFVHGWEAVPAWELPANPQLGRVIDQGVGSVLVEVEEQGKEVRVRWAPEVLVIPVAKFETEENVMATINPAAQNLLTRFKFQLQQLLKGGDKQKATAIERLGKILTESTEKSIQLPAPSGLGFGAVADNEVFADYEFAAVTQENSATPKVVGKPTKAQQGEATAAEAVAAAKAKKAEKDESKAASKPKREKKVIEPHECLDGCGQVLVTAGRFKPGHDAKLKSIIQKVERGELLMEDIPDAAQDLVKFKKGEELVEKDGKGKVVSKTQTYICIESPVKLPGR